MPQEPLKSSPDADAPFRARLKARDGVRPHSTLAILAGYDPNKAGGPGLPPPRPRPAARPVAELREVQETRRSVVEMPPPAATVRPAPRPPEPVRAPAAPPAAIRAPVAAVVPVPVPPVRQEPAAADEADTGPGGRYRRVMQLLFAGLALIGLAGLSFLAADNAFKTGTNPQPKDDDAAGADQTATLLPQGAGAVSALAVQEAAIPVGAEASPWFDYRGVADYLQARVAAFEAAEREAARLAELEAERLAAAAIAEAEADRLAAAAQMAENAEAGRIAAQEAERQRLAGEEAERIAQIEADRLAAEAAADAAARAEAQRLAEIEAQRAAAALAEQQRLAALETQRVAEAEARRAAEAEARRVAAEQEAQRLAEIEARNAAAATEEKRLAELAAQRAAEAEARRLAALEAQRAAEAAEARRLADLEAQRLAQLEAERLAAQVATVREPSITLAAAVAVPAPAARPSVPTGAASLKPARPQPQAPVILEDPVVRGAPTILTSRQPDVRPLGAAPVQRTADVFLAERVERSSAAAMDAAALETMQANFVRLAATAADGSAHTLTMPDGRALEVRFERTEALAPSHVEVRAVSGWPVAGGAVTRAFEAPPAVTVSVMCRDVAYVIPGQERGRFAVCQGQEGGWMLAKPSAPAVGPA
ncbi:MAG: hypothetical protein ACK4MQ_01365 [Hyphomonas sp.]